MTPNNQLSLFIPKVFANITKERISREFQQYIGKVSRIDFVRKYSNSTGEEYNSAFIHFDYWYDTPAAVNFQKRVINPEEQARFVYEDPWYWVCLENKANRYVENGRKIRIRLDNDLHKPHDDDTVEYMVSRETEQFEGWQQRITLYPAIMVDEVVADLKLKMQQINSHIEYLYATNMLFEPCKQVEKSIWQYEELIRYYKSSIEDAMRADEIEAGIKAFEDQHSWIVDDEAQYIYNKVSKTYLTKSEAQKRIVKANETIKSLCSNKGDIDYEVVLFYEEEVEFLQYELDETDEPKVHVDNLCNKIYEEMDEAEDMWASDFMTRFDSIC